MTTQERNALTNSTNILSVYADPLVWLLNTSNSLHPEPVANINTLHLTTIIVCVIVFFIGILGNLLVITAFGSKSSKIKASDLFLINLALADLFICIIVPGDKIYHIMGGNYRFIGHAGCKCIHFVSITSIGVSAITLLAISFDRYVIVKYPFRPRMNTRSLLCVCLFIWFVSSLLGIPYLIRDNVKLHVVDNETQLMVCRGFMSNNTFISHTVITFVVQVVIPMTIITITCVLIAFELGKVLKSELFQTRDRITRTRFKQNRKTVTLLIVLVLSFFTCVAPVNTFFLLYIFQIHNLSLDTADHVFTILLMLQLVNSCLNPLIYSKLHTSFRKTMDNWFFPCLRTNALKVQSMFMSPPVTRRPDAVSYKVNGDGALHEDNEPCLELWERQT